MTTGTLHNQLRSVTVRFLKITLVVLLSARWLTSEPLTVCVPVEGYVAFPDVDNDKNIDYPSDDPHSVEWVVKSFDDPAEACQVTPACVAFNSRGHIKWDFSEAVSAPGVCLYVADFLSEPPALPPPSSLTSSQPVQGVIEQQSEQPAPLLRPPALPASPPWPPPSPPEPPTECPEEEGYVAFPDLDNDKNMEFPLGTGDDAGTYNEGSSGSGGGDDNESGGGKDTAAAAAGAVVAFRMSVRAFEQPAEACRVNFDCIAFNSRGHLKWDFTEAVYARGVCLYVAEYLLEPPASPPPPLGPGPTPAPLALLLPVQGDEQRAAKGLALVRASAGSRTVWAVTGTSGSSTDAATEPPRRLGAPKAATLTRRTCSRPPAGLAWSPPSRKAAAGRSLSVKFTSSSTGAADAPTGSSVTAVGLYLLNVGTLDPLVMAVQLEVVPAGQSKPTWVTVFDATTSPQPALICPGLTNFPVAVSPASLSLAQPGLARLSAQQLADGSVRGARIRFNCSAVARLADLPAVAAVGLAVIEARPAASQEVAVS